MEEQKQAATTAPVEPLVMPSSEKRFGVVEQPGEICPLVDTAIDCCKRAMSAIRGYERLSEEELRDAMGEVESELSELIGWNGSGLCDDIRAANIAIREWGQQWKELCKEHLTPEQIEA